MDSNHEPLIPFCGVVTIGTELVLGQIIDTNTSYMAQALADEGFRIRLRLAVGDELPEIVDALRIALERCDLLITTGGLGPTLDDLTREAVAAVAQAPLEFHQDLMEDIEVIFRRSGYKMAENNRRQAFVPRAALPIRNPVGTAPGFISVLGRKAIICLPGVPRELKYLFPRAVVPWIREFFGMSDQVLVYRTLKTAGIGESQVDSLIGDLIKPGGNPEVGLLASPGEIKIRIAVRADTREEGLKAISPVEEDIRRRLGRRIFGAEGDTLEGVILKLLEARGLSLAVLESFTGGMASAWMSRIPDFPLKEGLVIREEEALGMLGGAGGPDAARREGFAEGLAEAFLARSGADIVLLIFGIAAADAAGYHVKAYSIVKGKGVRKSFSWEMGGDYEMLRHRGAATGLNTLRLALLEAQEGGGTGPPP